MHIRILDLDGAVTAQQELVRRHRPQVVALQDWGPQIRIASSFAAYRRFEKACADHWCDNADGPVLTLYGSGDFHHVTLALLRRLREPFNLLVLDKHPDWMRGIPFMHSGTWLNHAFKLPNLRRVFHIGGDLDFDNSFYWFAPWPQLGSGAVTMIPAVRSFTRGRWRDVPNRPLRDSADRVMMGARLTALLTEAGSELARYPLYITLDKDLMRVEDAIVNWDSGCLQLSEVQSVLSEFVRACGGRLAGMDIVGDWSPVRVRGLMRHVLHWTEHPSLQVDPAEATERNARTNLIVIDTLRASLALAA
jgi:hypothetical protein